jgi:transcriptional regulator with XRE-family HTH domain
MVILIEIIDLEAIMPIGDKIKRLRQEKNWSQDQLADKIDVGRRFISNYENGKNLPSASTLQKLAEVFEVSVDYLLSDDQIKNLASVQITDKTLIEYFEEIQHMSPSDQQAIKTLLEAMIIKNKMTSLIQKP